MKYLMKIMFILTMIFSQSCAVVVLPVQFSVMVVECGVGIMLAEGAALPLLPLAIAGGSTMEARSEESQFFGKCYLGLKKDLEYITGEKIFGDPNRVGRQNFDPAYILLLPGDIVFDTLFLPVDLLTETSSSTKSKNKKLRDKERKIW